MNSKHNYTGARPGIGRVGWARVISRRPRVGGADAVGQGREARLRRAKRKQRPADEKREAGTDARRLVGKSCTSKRADDEVSSTRLEREAQFRALVHRQRRARAARAVEEDDVVEAVGDLDAERRSTETDDALDPSSDIIIVDAGRLGHVLDGLLDVLVREGAVA